MRKVLSTMAVVAASIAFAQVGINTSDTPRATLDVRALEGSTPDGILIPRVDKDRAQNMATPEKSTLAWINNTGTGGSRTVDVDADGFYYFYNPNVNQGTEVSKGRWIRLGDKADELSAKKVTGTFTHQGGTITPELTEMPDANDIKSIVSIKFYRVEETGQDPLDGAVMSTSLYSYKKAEKKAVFGQGPMSISMPAGKYAYEIVYN